MASSHWPGEGPCLPSSETGSPRVAPSAIHALLYVALASTAFSKRLLSQALRGGQGRAATGHTGHHRATRGASCRAHGVPQNLQGSGSHRRGPAKPLSSRHSSKVLDLKRCPANGRGSGVGGVVVYSSAWRALWSQGKASHDSTEERHLDLRPSGSPILVLQPVLSVPCSWSPKMVEAPPRLWLLRARGGWPWCTLTWL